MSWAVQSREGITAIDYRSTWVMLARNEASATEAGLGETGWERPAIAPSVTPWTDDWANVLGTMKSWTFWQEDD